MSKLIRSIFFVILPLLFTISLNFDFQLSTLFAKATKVSQYEPQEEISLVLLGATGNLAEKYLWQALFKLQKPNLKIFPSATKGSEVGQPLLDSILFHNVTDYVGSKIKKESFLENNIFPYKQLRTSGDFQHLGELMEKELSKEKIRIFYLSVPPKFFGSISKNINEFVLPKDLKETRVFLVIEKPFGTDLKSAIELNNMLKKNLHPKVEVLLIDHYLGKSDTNPIEEKEINKIEITMFGTETVEKRTKFYSEVGVVRDTIQNHLLMMFWSLASIYDKEKSRLDILQDVKTIEEEDILVLGQYNSYLKHLEEDFGKEYNNFQKYVPSYCSLSLNTKSAFKKVKVELKSGKSLNERKAYIKIFLKEGSFIEFIVTPEAKIKTNSKRLQEKISLESLKFYSQSSPAYEVILRSLIYEKEYSNYFMKLDEVLESWRIFDPILELTANTLYEIGETPENIEKKSGKEEL
eukprot:snap_masked-scaffold_16-processed-gene-0.27-mRNA-1 protein AED:1.00 eAED:1.00 QI:0/0/0/0/1/1/2/0/464